MTDGISGTMRSTPLPTIGQVSTMSKMTPWIVSADPILLEFHLPTWRATALSMDGPSSVLGLPSPPKSKATLKSRSRKQAQNYCFVPVVAATTGELHPESLRLLYDFARLKTDAAEKHAVENSLRSPLTPEQLCQRRGATFARLRMEAQLYSLRASATRLTGKYWAAPYASSLLPRSRARARCGIGAFAPAPAAHVLASR